MPVTSNPVKREYINPQIIRSTNPDNKRIAGKSCKKLFMGGYPLSI